MGPHTIADLTAQQWIDLLNAAGVEDLDSVRFAIAEGPMIVPVADSYVVVVSAEHYDYEQMQVVWNEVEKAWADGAI